MIGINDVIFAVVGAGILFILYKAIAGAIRIFITRASIIPFNPDQIDHVLENCYRTFPIESFDFNGDTFRRGVEVRITTNRNITIEGQFIGANQSEMVCLMTDETVIAQEIGSIMEIKPL
ncbi:MAG: hypothetical protein FWE11_06180 [Defluviitaleaceae bacterium]|nr:hypothetical protein [Defluviitaleaceae bacterium]